MSATITVRQLPELGEAVRHYELDCHHATTRITMIAGRAPFTAEAAVRLLLLRHFAGTPCTCIRRLWRKHLGAEQPEVRLA